MIQLPFDSKKSEKMASYMRNQFKFSGVDATQRHTLEKEAWKEIKQLLTEELFNEIKKYYDQDTREYQYLAIDLAVRAKKRWNKDYLLKFLEMSQSKMWWDTIDVWRKLFSEYVKLHPEDFNWVGKLFYEHEIFWVRRMGIILQLGFKQKVDTDYLSKMITNDINTDEFFIQKAIGWALRDYGKIDPKWVKKFVKDNELSSLAKKEALKLIIKENS
ncbi:DNA alkylation repair protein [Companilactobacillus sp. DQM5]|uniref:DNA alkylation repair protein n=1 Tax=Companilactobacillus sp. DQM5 TaxID=3463359 RepID=UPI0040595A0B